MKIRNILLTAMMARALGASAVPASPGLMDRTLADGTQVKIRLNGDEHFHYMTDEQGFLLENSSQGLRYILDGGTRVQATAPVLETMRQDQAMQSRAPRMQHVAPLDGNGRTTFPTKGDMHFLVILAQFQDTKFHDEANIRQMMTDHLNKEGYDANGATGSVREYLMDNSMGQFRPTFDVSPVYTVAQNSVYYTGNGKHAKESEMVGELVKLADKDIDFSKYCIMEPGVVDAVIIFYAGYGQADTSDPTCIWPHQSNVIGLNYTADGVKIGPYCMFNELDSYSYGKEETRQKRLAGIGTPVHEFSHVMGLPDLYDPNYLVKTTPANWSVMDAGCYLNASMTPPCYSSYERYSLGWLDYETVVPGTDYSLENLADSGRALRINVEKGSGIYNNEYFLLETRTQKDWDKYLPDQGMLIWHIDYNSSNWNMNRVNSDEKHKRVDILAANGAGNYFLGDTNSRLGKGAAWPQAQTYITPDTPITFNAYYSFAKYPTGNSFITDIAYDPEEGVTTFGYNRVTETPTDVTVLHMPTQDFENGRTTRKLTFTWDPVEGATDYQLSLFRVESDGKIWYESGIQNKSTEGATTFTSPRLTTAKMDMEYHAQVRVVKGIPSSEISNEVIFIPSQLKETVGLHDITCEAFNPVGGTGCITAPADALIFNMQGVRCPADGLQPGIYLVRTGNRTAKVIVK